MARRLVVLTPVAAKPKKAMNDGTVRDDHCTSD